MYNDKVMEIFKNPPYAGVLDDANAIGLVGNASCGDILKIYLKIQDDVIVDARFQTFGCAAAIASSATAVKMIIGKTIDEALSLTNYEIVEELEGLPPQKIHCSVLAEEAIAKAIEEYKLRKKAKK